MQGSRSKIFIKLVPVVLILILAGLLLSVGKLSVWHGRDAKSSSKNRFGISMCIAPSKHRSHFWTTTNLYAAVQRSDLATVKTLLSEHADPNVCAPVSFSWMFWQHHTGFRASALRSAVEQAVTNSYQSKPGSIPAAREQEIVVALLDAGAHPAPDDGGNNLLEWTLPTVSNHLTLATEALIKHGAPLPALLSGQPLLAGAINYRTPPATIDALLHAGADVKGAAGYAALTAAYIQCEPSIPGHQDALASLRSLLVAGADPNVKEENGEPVLWYAVIHAMSESPQDKARKVELLLAHGANVHARWEKGTVQEAAHREAKEYHIDSAILTLLDRAAAGTKPSR